MLFTLGFQYVCSLSDGFRRFLTLIPTLLLLTHAQASLLEPALTSAEVNLTKTSTLEEDSWIRRPIAGSESIWTLFKQEQLSEFDLLDLFSVPGAGQYLGQLTYTRAIHYQTDDHRNLKQIKLLQLSGETLLFKRHAAGFDMLGSDTGSLNRSLNPTPSQDSQPLQRFAGTVSNNFIHSGKAAGLSQTQMVAFTQLFQSNIDFSRDLQPGDRFEVLIQSSDNNTDRQANIVAASLYQRNQSFNAFLHSDGEFYSSTGALLGSTLSRNPLGYDAPVSSGFDMNRRHPIHGVVRPHLGTDWKVPVGTPVYAVADGVVKEAINNHPQAGHYIELNNGHRYVTRYLHLDRLKVNTGQRVKKGDLIGYSGNTGLSTGPHLHFELHIDGQPVDVMTATLPEAQLEGVALKAFIQRTKPLLAQLSGLANASVLASLPSEEKRYATLN